MNFYSGFSVITGETGAGKSIILGALSLILGKRADTQVLLDKSRKCIIEGTFDTDGYDLQGFFDSHDLDYESSTILRREITPGGKSRAFINDTPVNLAVLKEISEKLVDIHSQHQTITLNRTDFQLAVIDSFAGITEEVSAYNKVFSSYKAFKNEYRELQEVERQSRADEDYYRFQFDELDKARLDATEQTQLEDQLQVLSHAEEIRNNLMQAQQIFSSEEQGIINSASEVEKLLARIAPYHKDIAQALERLSENLIDLKDISHEIERVGQQTDYHPAQIEEINERLDLFYHLQQKHRVNNNHELLRIKDELDQKLQNISSIDDKINELSQHITGLENSLVKAAEEISARRTGNIGAFEKEVEKKLRSLGMPDAVFKVDHHLLESFNADGIDKIRYLFSANKGLPPGPVSSIASGGELSRLMLTIKSLISQKNLLPTIIYDEIDSGISGSIAAKVGKILRESSSSMQVITITHLPQIAGKGQNHYLVYKESADGTAQTLIRQLDDNERVGEIAKMLSGTVKSDAAQQTAKELLN